MKTLRLIMIGAILTGIFAVTGFAQVAGAGKIGVINTIAFGGDAKGLGGITKYISAQKRLDGEFKVENQQLTTLATRINALKKEIANLQKSASAKVPINKTVLNQKALKHDDLVRELKFKQEQAKAKFQVRQGAVMGPVSQDIGKALQVFAKQKGFAMILDAAKLESAGLILAYTTDARLDITQAFIVYYNKRPAGTASTIK